MGLEYYHAECLEPLLDCLRNHLRQERENLPPQKTQVIVVGNREVEAWLTRCFLEEYRVLMGVSFPFLESAITAFCSRLQTQKFPHRNESWFLPPIADDELNAVSAVEMEILLLGIFNTTEGSMLLRELGYNAALLTPTQLVTLAGHLLSEIRETLLHCPATLAAIMHKDSKSLTAAERLWYYLEKRLRALGRPFPAFDPALPDWLGRLSLLANTEPETLHIFAMPLFSAFHIRIITAIARFLPVKLYMVDLSPHARSHNPLLSTVGVKALGFKTILQQACHQYQVSFTPVHCDYERRRNRTFSICALPGVWRAAELMGDEFHNLLTENSQLYQDEIAVGLTDPETQFLAFDRALGMRELIAFAREKFFPVAHEITEFWQIIAEAAQSGVSRALVARYFLNPLVADRCEKESVNPRDFLAILEKAHGYRDDYPDMQSVYSFESGLRRVARGSVLNNSGDSALPASVTLTVFDNPYFVEKFYHFLSPLFSARQTFSSLTGKRLAAAMVALQQQVGSEEPVRILTRFFKNIEELPEFAELRLSTVIQLLQRHLDGKSLAQQTGREGVIFSSLFASCYTRDTHLLFDLCEDVDRSNEGRQILFSEVSDAPTRLSTLEQVRIQLATALASNARSILLAYSNRDPATGAEKYPSQALANISEVAEILGRQEKKKGIYPLTLRGSYVGFPPIAADADRKTLWLTHRYRQNPEPLSNWLLPALIHDGKRVQIALREIFDYLANPAAYCLWRYLPGEEQIAAFRREEPRLAVSSSARLKFCEDYIEHVLFEARGDRIPSAIDFVSFKQARGDYAPEGFDQAMGLLMQDGNNDRLTSLACNLREELVLVEFVFQDGLTSPFTIRETPRLERHYLPAVSVCGIPITGTSPMLVCSKSDEYFYLMSTIYPERNRLLVELHLLLSVFAYSGKELPRLLSIVDLNTKSKSANPIAAIGRRAVAVCRIQNRDSAARYLENVINAMVEKQLVCYDHSYISQGNLSSWVGRNDEEILNGFRKVHSSDEGVTAPQTNRLEKFFALSPNEQSVDFFKKFILPVAEMDALENSEKAPAKKTQKASQKNSKGSKK